jgi:hypothetical protein
VRLGLETPPGTLSATRAIDSSFRVSNWDSARDVSCGECSHNSGQREALEELRTFDGSEHGDDWEIDFSGLFQGN